MTNTDSEINGNFPTFLLTLVRVNDIAFIAFLKSPPGHELGHKNNMAQGDQECMGTAISLCFSSPPVV
jgi:hypothetical protein